MTDRYHHGDLPTALRAAAAELVAERGPTGFSLREVARRAGVSHGAPAHHFGTSKGLLTSVAAEGFENVSTAFEQAIEEVDDPVERLTAMGKAYVRIAIQNPGHFGVMCSHELIDVDDEAYATHSSRAYLQLIELITEIRDTLNPDLDVDAAATMTWSAVHGLAALSPSLDDVADKTDTTVEPLDQMIEKFTHMFINGFSARPR